MESHLFICVNRRPIGQPSCGGRDSAQLADWLEAEIDRRGLDIPVERLVCMGHCRVGPNVKVKAGPMIHGATRETLAALLDDFEQQAQGDASG